MSDKQLYIAYVIDKFDGGQQLLKFLFEYPIVEFWGESEEQEKMKDYFEQNHYSKERPFQIEIADFIDCLPFNPNPNTNK